MQRSIPALAALAAALVLAGCGHHHGRHGDGVVPPEASLNPRVLTDARGNLFVGLEPLRFYGRDGSTVRIVWRLPEGSGLQFAKNGIVVEAVDATGPRPDGFKCFPGERATEFVCENTLRKQDIGVQGTAEFKYTVTTVRAGKGRNDPAEVQILDPRIINHLE